MRNESYYVNIYFFRRKKEKKTAFFRMSLYSYWKLPSVLVKKFLQYEYIIYFSFCNIGP